MKKLLVLAAVALLLAPVSATADDNRYPWNDHAAPYSFLFGNDIDTHQQTQKLSDGSLTGFFYISYTGVATADDYPVATHVDCTTTTSCTVGWRLRGKALAGEFLYQVGSDHPVFLVNRADIPDPGAYAHFHWLDYADTLPPVGVSVPGYLLQLRAVGTFCFIHSGADAASKNKTCRDNGGVAVKNGIDIATHVNIVTSYP